MKTAVRFVVVCLVSSGLWLAVSSGLGGLTATAQTTSQTTADQFAQTACAMLLEEGRSETTVIASGLESGLNADQVDHVMNEAARAHCPMYWEGAP